MDTLDYIKTNNFVIKVVKIISRNEGTYNSVVNDDNLSLSIGVLQWHGYRAKTLLKLIVNKNITQAKKILEDTTILSDLDKDDDYWNTRIINSMEGKKISYLLNTTEGKHCQNQLAIIDTNSYIQHGISIGITDLTALAYFADLENHYGPYTAERIAKASHIKNNLTLNDIFQASMLDSKLRHHKHRRIHTYIMITKTKF